MAWVKSNSRRNLFWGFLAFCEAILCCSWFFPAAAYEVPTPTDNEGMRKIERIDKIEQDTISLAKEFVQKAQEQNLVLKKLQEQNTQLETSLKNLQEDFGKLQREMAARFDEIQKRLPPIRPTRTPVPTANI